MKIRILKVKRHGYYCSHDEYEICRECTLIYGSEEKEVTLDLYREIKNKVYSPCRVIQMNQDDYDEEEFSIEKIIGEIAEQKEREIASEKKRLKELIAKYGIPKD